MTEAELRECIITHVRTKSFCKDFDADFQLTAVGTERVGKYGARDPVTWGVVVGGVNWKKSSHMDCQNGFWRAVSDAQRRFDLKATNAPKAHPTPIRGVLLNCYLSCVG